MKVKLHWKLTFVFCLVLIVGLFIGYSYLVSHLKAELDSNLENSLKRELTLARDFLEIRMGDRGELTDADILADRVGQDLGVRVTVITSDGHVIGDSNLSSDEIRSAENHLQRIEVQGAILKGFGKSKRYSFTLRRYLLYVAAPFGKGAPSGIVRLAIPLSTVETFEARLSKIAFFSLILVFILSAGFTFIISLVISRPLREMSVVARAIAKGDFSRKPSISSDDEVGDLSRAIAYMSDEIQEKIERVEQGTAKLDAVLSSMSEGLMVVDEKKRILILNPAMRQVFLIKDPFENKQTLEVLRHTAISDVVEKLIGGKPCVVSEEINLATPVERTFKVNGAPIIREGRLEGAVLVFHDITELRRLEKVRQDFVANVSHELRTPVSSIKGYAETLLDGAIDDKVNGREFVTIIKENSDRLVSLIDDLLDLAKIESGKMPMVFVLVDLRVVVTRCLGLLENAVARKSLHVAVDIPSGFEKVRADEARLAQVFLNILDNAVKYTPNGGSIKVATVRQDKFIRVDVEDTGIGIPKEELPRIFERFYRIDKARSYELGGTGLGLSIVKHIVHAHGGDVLVHSEIGRGSTFSFTIPVA